MTYYPEVIVGALDIIGMKNILKRNDELDMATKIIGQLCGIIEINNQLKFYWKQFGDSIYLIAHPKEDLDVQIDKIAFSVASLTAIGIFGEKIIGYNFLLSSGIGIGDISAAKWNYSDIPYFIGNSMANAYVLQEKQNWFGGCISKDIEERFIKSEFLIEYSKIPIEENYCKGHALNWLKASYKILKKLDPDFIFKVETIYDKIKNISDDIGSTTKDNDKINKKLENTKNFIAFCIDNGYL